MNILSFKNLINWIKFQPFIKESFLDFMIWLFCYELHYLNVTAQVHSVQYAEAF